MRKLKTWEIVLLVIFYPVGICVLIYRLVKKGKLKREREEAQRAAAEERERRAAEEQKRRDEKAAADRERREREEAYRASMERLIFRVVGVTFKNEGGRSRQTILREIKREEPSEVFFSLRKYEYEGEPAVGVFYHEEQVGNISRDDLRAVLDRLPRFQKVEAYDVTGGFTYDDGSGERANYGLKIAVYFKKAA